MSEDHNKNEHRSKSDRFIWGFLIMLLPYLILFFSLKMYSGYGLLNALVMAVLFLLFGTVLWAISKLILKKRMLGLGFLIGGLSSLLVIFVCTGGCGIFVR